MFIWGPQLLAHMHRVVKRHQPLHPTVCFNKDSSEYGGKKTLQVQKVIPSSKTSYLIKTFAFI